LKRRRDRGHDGSAGGSGSAVVIAAWRRAVRPLTSVVPLSALRSLALSRCPLSRFAARARARTAAAPLLARFALRLVSLRFFARIAVYTMIALMYLVLFGFVGLTFAYSCFYDGARAQERERERERGREREREGERERERERESV
jgi:hypothetical protein